MNVQIAQRQSLFFNDFQSQTYGSLDWEKMLDKLFAYVGSEPGLRYELIIGSDSMPAHSHTAEFVSAVVVHRHRSGGIYFWTKKSIGQIRTLRQRIFEEALLSLRLAEQLIEAFKARQLSDFNLTIHVDIGPNGETKQMMHEIVGMIRGNGFEAKIKPHAYAANKVADRYV